MWNNYNPRWDIENPFQNNENNENTITQRESHTTVKIRNVMKKKFSVSWYKCKVGDLNAVLAYDNTDVRNLESSSTCKSGQKK